MKKINKLVIFLILAATAGTLGAIVILVFLSESDYKENSVFIAQTLLTFALVAVTSIYVIQTAEIASATRKQAEETRNQAEITRQQSEASVKIAEETRKHRLSEARPYLLIRLNGLHKILKNNGFNKIPDRFQISIKNVGKGPAINVRVAYWYTGVIFPFVLRGYISPEETWQTEINTQSVNDVKEKWLTELHSLVSSEGLGAIAIQYKDVHEMNWSTYLRLMRYIQGDGEYVREGEQSIIEVHNYD